MNINLLVLNDFPFFEWLHFKIKLVQVVFVEVPCDPVVFVKRFGFRFFVRPEVIFGRGVMSRFVRKRGGSKWIKGKVMVEGFMEVVLVVTVAVRVEVEGRRGLSEVRITYDI